MKLKDIKDQGATVGRMHKHCPEQSDAARKYYAAFPALKKADHSPSQYYLPPPAWCRKDIHNNNKESMHADLIQPNDWNKKKFISGKERRNSYHGQRKYKKRCNSYSRSFESKEELPEWVTYEGVWDMETQDPVREFIRAIALDEGYGTCENTVTDELREINQINMKMKEVMVPDWEISFDLNKEWILKEDLKPATRTPMEEEMYAKFEAKFNSSIEALWTKDLANTPDDEYQDLPIDVHDLLSSPSDQQFYDPPEKTYPSLTESIWSNDATDSTLLGFNTKRAKTPTKSVDNLHDKFKPLNLEDNTIFKQPNPQSFQPEEPFSFYNFDRIYDAIPTVTGMMRSLSTLNHCKTRSSFTEVVPRKYADKEPFERTVGYKSRETRPKLCFYNNPSEDLLTSSRTHFRPIRKETETVQPSRLTRYLDGASFDIRGDLDPVDYRRSDSGYMVVEKDGQSTRYLEYRSGEGIDYSRLNLTAAQREANQEFVDPDEFRLKFAVKHLEKAVQTEETMLVIVGCDECGQTGGAKKMRASGERRVRCETMRCGRCDAQVEGVAEVSMISEMSVMSTGSREVSVCDRKRRHSAALRCPRASGPCSHPHAPFLHCCALDRPLTR